MLYFRFESWRGSIEDDEQSVNIFTLHTVAVQNIDTVRNGVMTQSSFRLGNSDVEVEINGDDITLEQDNGGPFPERVTISFEDLVRLQQEVRRRA